MAPYSISQDKSRYLSILKEVTVTVSLLEYPLTNTKAESATTINMSENGICFISSTQYRSDTLLSVKIELQGWQHHLQNVTSIIDTASLTKPLTAIAEVIGSKELPQAKGYETSVRFKDIYEDDYKAFITYLEHISSRDKS